VRIEKSQRVVLRDDSGELVSARPGEEFVRRDGTTAGYTLKSADASSGKVTLEGQEFVMYAPR